MITVSSLRMAEYFAADGWADRHWAIGEGTIRWGAVFAALARLNGDPRFDWLTDLEARQATGDVIRLVLDLQGIRCAACVWLIERIFRRHEGGLRIIVDAQLGQMRFWWERGAFDAVAFAEELQHFGQMVQQIVEG